jgi:hypothetical protein
MDRLKHYLAGVADLKSSGMLCYSSLALRRRVQRMLLVHVRSKSNRVQQHALDTPGLISSKAHSPRAQSHAIQCIPCTG